MAGTNDMAIAYGSAHTMAGACPYCSGPHTGVIHGGACPRIKAIEYHPNGAVKRVEMREPPPAFPVHLRDDTIHLDGTRRGL